MTHYMQRENSILLTAIKDPFNPHNSRVVNKLDYEGKTAQQYINEIYPEIPKDFDIIASVNGSIVDDVSLTIPMPGQNIVFCLHPSGDDAARLIASLAVIVIAIYAPYLWGLAGGAALSSQSAALLSAGVAIGGAIIVNALLPMQQPEAQASSASYSWGGTNLTTEGGAWPVIYGTAKILPPIIGAYLYNQYPGKQYLNLLMAISDHAVTSIDSIKLNGSTYSNYPNVTAYIGWGATDQPVIPNFRDTHTQQTVGTHITRTPVIIDIPGDANKVVVNYTVVGDTFSAEIVGEAKPDYVLVYYKDNEDRFTNPATAISVDNITGDLPNVGDANIVTDYSNEYPTTPHGAKIWYIPSDAILEGNVVDWDQANSFYFESKLIQYNANGDLILYGNSSLVITPVYTIGTYANGPYTITTTIA